MGGYGSGKRHRWNTRDTTSGSLPLDVRSLHRKVILRPGCTFTSRWWRGTPENASTIGGIVRTDRVILFYRRRPGSGDPVKVEETVWLDWTPCHYGGRRPWWLCPGCGRRVAVLYYAGRFRCRTCHRLAYPSQNDGLLDRAREKAQAIRRRLGGGGSIFQPFPDRPKGMHWSTYARLADQEYEAHLRWAAALTAEIRRMDARTQRVASALRERE